MSDNFITLQKKPEVLDSCITVTPDALHKIFELVEKSGSKGVVLTIRGGGCSGYIYDLELIEQDTTPPIEADKKTFKVTPRTGVLEGPIDLFIYVPNLAIPLVKGTEIWYDDKLIGGGIKFNNPNAKRTCGCGESFS